jgi:hypothetical protein
MKTRYVYFDKVTGVIKEILSNRKKGRGLYIECDNDVVAPIVMGQKGLHEVVVAYDREQDKHLLLEKDNVIRLRYYGDKLYKIPRRVIADYDLRLDLYAGGDVLEVSVDPSRMSHLYSTNFRDGVVFEKGTEVRIFVKNKAGDKLLKTVVIDAQKLLDNVQMFFELGDGIDDNDVSFYTHRVFDNYMWRKGTAKFLSPVKERIRFEIQKADLKRRRDDFEYHLIIREDDNGIKIENNIENPKLVKIFDEIDFYIVDKYDPAILYDKFTLQHSNFRDKEIFVKSSESLKDKGILYNHKHISILLEGQDHE